MFSMLQCKQSSPEKGKIFPTTTAVPDHGITVRRRGPDRCIEKRDEGHAKGDRIRGNGH